jgi:hypothetical protein
MLLTDHYTSTVSVDHTPDEVFAAITDVRGWWNENILGGTADLGDEFVFADQGIRFSRFRLTEVVPGKRVVWQVVDAYLSFIEEHDEWTGTRVVFDLTAGAEGTTIHFTHEGLMAASPCFEACSRGWDFYTKQSLPMLIATGTGQPIPKGEA